MAYVQTFPSLNGQIYKLTIGGTNVTSVQAPLAVDPVTTEEDADTDMFAPIRKQSGYIRLLATDPDTWRGLIPSSVSAEPVTISKNNVVLWQGYVQTGTYSMSFPATFNEVQLPLICPLSALECFDVDVNGPADMVTVGELLSYIFGKLTGLSFNVVFMTGSVTVVQNWLGYKVIWRNFLNKTADGLEPRFTCFEILEELCKFFGWTCRTIGTSICFTAAADRGRNTHTITYTIAQLTGSTTPSTIAAIPTLQIADSFFASADHSEEYIPGIKSATVNSELNYYSVLVEIPVDNIFRTYKYDTPFIGIRWKDSVEGPVDAWIMHRQALDYEDGEVEITSYAEAEVDGQSMCYGRFIAFDEDMDDNKTQYNWTKCFECFISDDYGERRSDTPLFTIKSKKKFTIGDGVLYISGRIDGLGRENETGRMFHVYCTLRIGNYYCSGDFHGYTWTTTPSTCSLMITRTEILATDTPYNHAIYDGTGIVINTPITGEIYFAVHNIERWPNVWNGYFPLMEFNIGFVRDGEDSDLNDKSYEATGGQFPDKVNIDTIFSSDKTVNVEATTYRCQAGYGLLYDGQRVLDTAPFGSTTGLVNEKPEQHIANTIGTFGQSSRRVLTLDLWSTLIGETIGPNSRVRLGSSNYYPIAVSRHWRDDVTRLTLMQLDPNM